MAKLFKHNILTRLNQNVTDGYAKYVGRDRCCHMDTTQRKMRMSDKRRAQVDMRMQRGVGWRWL